ncbi:spore coat U domain-containing protein [Candidatus Berkiella cookevillensis]|uniref:Spore Coat Protein U domain protein n=1 Tax=Candidatus Berkiella cookevillensis TaxID=437022 RepID=A0A0Q9YJV8_9GAMM|nr:spore coat U domain-containing protein [Candidatus Berkiella cookevillensis]MCS5707365.1 spore coat U domain-containing protein [Candidatus Berkiella cookevillensis]
MNKSKLLLVLFFVLSFLAKNAYALCLGLGCSCSIATNSFNFGAYNPLSPTAKDLSGSLSVTCGSLLASVSVAYTVSLSTGNSGTYTQRSMLNGANILNYNFYTDAGRTTIWGNGGGGTSMISNSYILGLLFPRTDNFTIYGRIPALQNVPIGAYTDNIVATVTF